MLGSVGLDQSRQCEKITVCELRQSQSLRHLSFYLATGKWRRRGPGNFFLSAQVCSSKKFLLGMRNPNRGFSARTRCFGNVFYLAEKNECAT